jgi:hypothetical protein
MNSQWRMLHWHFNQLEAKACFMENNKRSDSKNKINP